MLHYCKKLSGDGNTGLKHGINNAISISRKMFMLPVKIVRSLFAVLLSCVIALNCFTSPAFADTGSSINSFVNGFWQAIGAVVGGAAATVATCYAVDVFIAPVAPPAAAYLATLCPAIGGTVGGVGGAVSINAMSGAQTPNLSQVSQLQIP